MIQIVLRGLFIVMAAAVAGLYGVKTFTASASGLTMSIVVALLISAAVVGLDMATTRKKISALSGLFIGMLGGLLAAYALTFLVDYVYLLFPTIPNTLIEGVKVFSGVVCVFVTTSLVLQTKDDFRFVIPYVEFTRQLRGTQPMLLDTSAIIDGRILDVGGTHILQGLIVIPRFVLHELQAVADSSDKLKRGRGRRGLDIVAKLQATPALEVTIEDADAEGGSVDQKLVSLALELHARIITTDFNLTKIARLRGVDVVNINQLAEALRPALLPGEQMNVKIVKPGEAPTQGVGYLDDGTMVVVENARDRVGQEIPVAVTSSLQTSAGKMVFGRFNPTH